MVGKRLEVQGSMALGFVDLEKAFDTVPREMVMATLRWMEVPEAEVRMVEGTYEKTIYSKSGGRRRSIGGVWGQDWTEAGQRAEPAEDKCREDGRAHRPPEGRAGHRAGGEETDSGRLFRVPRRGSVRRREDGERGTSKSTGWSDRVESSWGSDGGPADLKKTQGQGHEHLCDTGMPVRNGNLGTDLITTTKAASVRKQLGTKNSKSDEGRQAKNGGVKGRDGSAKEPDRETGEEQITVGWTCRKDGGWQATEDSGRVTWAGQEETREAKAEMWGLC